MKSKKKNSAATVKKHWVRLTRACNNRCVFCLDSETHDGSVLTVRTIARDLQKGIKRGCQRAVLSGGEPTLHPDFLDIIAFAKRLGYSQIQVITNGRLFFYRDFLKACVDKGLTEVTFSLPSHLKQSFEAQTKVKGSFVQAMTGLMHALALRGLIVSVDIVISKQNYKSIYNTVRYFRSLGVNEFDLLQVVPFGKAWENKKKVMYDVKQAMPYLRKVFALARKRGVYIWTNRFPPQYLEDFPDLIQHPVKLFDEIRGRQKMFEDYLREGKTMFCFNERCSYCFIKGVCSDLVLSLIHI